MTAASRPESLLSFSPAAGARIQRGHSKDEAVVDDTPHECIFLSVLRQNLWPMT
jgi:hypothetical protein